MRAQVDGASTGQRPLLPSVRRDREQEAACKGEQDRQAWR